MPRRPARRRQVVPGAKVPCVRNKDLKCTAEATEYAMNAWYCRVHDPKGDPACTHSLGSPRCAYCGARPSE